MKHEHQFERRELKYKLHDSGPAGEVYAVVYICVCGEPGYEVPCS